MARPSEGAADSNLGVAVTHPFFSQATGMQKLEEILGLRISN